jgi:hypothetical protein
MTKETWKQSFKDCFQEVFENTNVYIDERSENFWTLRYKDSKNAGFAMFNYRKGDLDEIERQTEALQFVSHNSDNMRYIRVIDKLHLKDIFRYVMLKKEMDSVYYDVIKYNKSLGLQRDKKIEAILK